MARSSRRGWTPRLGGPRALYHDTTTRASTDGMPAHCDATPCQQTTSRCILFPLLSAGDQQRVLHLPLWPRKSGLVRSLGRNGQTGLCVGWSEEHEADFRSELLRHLSMDEIDPSFEAGSALVKRGRRHKDSVGWVGRPLSSPVLESMVTDRFRGLLARRRGGAPGPGPRPSGLMRSFSRTLTTRPVRLGTAAVWSPWRVRPRDCGKGTRWSAHARVRWLTSAGREH